MSVSHDDASSPVTSWTNRDSRVEDRDRVSMFDVKYGRLREKIVLQRLIVIGRLPRDAANRTGVGAHFENLTFELSKQHVWDAVTGLLLLYPSCLLLVVESTRDVLVSVLKDVHVLQQQQQPDCVLQEAKIAFLAHNPAKRLFQQWSYKVLAADQVSADVGVRGQKEEEESTELLVGGVLSALQKFSTRLQISKDALPGAVLDETPELVVPQRSVETLLGRGDLLSPDQYLQMYDAPRHVSMEFGQVNLRSFFPSV